MKHPNNRRPIIAVLVLVLILSVLPVTALADIIIFQDICDTRTGYIGDTSHILHSQIIDLLPNGTESQTISIQDYDRVIRMNGKVYEFMGMGSWNTTEKIPIDNQVESMILPPFPTSGTDEEREAWLKTYGEIALLYGPEKQEVEPEVDPDGKPEAHVHVPYSNQWFSTPTNHFHLCKECGSCYDMDWHHDYDGDGLCDRCGQEIVNYKMTVLDTKNGKVTLSRDEAALNDRIEVTVEPDEGYVLQELHFYKLNSCRSELTRYEDVPGAEYHLFTPTYDVEIQAVFAKK